MLDSTIPAEWFAQGDLDVQAAEILLAQNGPLAIVAFHLQLEFRQRPRNQVFD